MDYSLLLLIANLAWLLVVSSKWGRKQFSARFRLAIAIMLVAIATLNVLFN